MNYNLYKSDKASNYIHHFKTYIKTHIVTAVVLYLRESTEHQRENLETLSHIATRYLRHFDVNILKIFSEVESSSVNNDRLYLEMACQYAKENNAMVVAYSADRYIRYVCYKDDVKKTPMKKEYLGLNKISSGVVLTTILPPDMPQDEVRRHYIMNGRNYKNKKGGRPPVTKKKKKKKKRERCKPGEKLQRRLKYKPQVIKYYNMDGVYLIDVVKKFSFIPRQTVINWIRK